MKHFEFIKPYSIREQQGLIFASYFVCFEESDLFGPIGLPLARQVTAALNGAYNLGRSNMMIELGVTE